MTTKITINAHAGWPVRVTSLSTNGDFTARTVAPNTVQEFHVYEGTDLRVHEVQPNEAPSFGDIAVGRSFNPSGHPCVNRLKALYAEIINICSSRSSVSDTAAARHWSVAITDAETAQMRAVKAATWK